MQLRPRHFDWKQGATDDLGFIAEEVAAAPMLVQHSNGELSGVKYRHLTSLITKVVQDQQRTIEMLESEVERLRLRLSEVETPRP